MQLFKPNTPVVWNGKPHIVEYITIRANVVMVRMYGLIREVNSEELTCEPTVISYTQTERE